MCSQVLQVLLDPPQCVSALLQLRYLIVSEGHVDHTAHTVTVQDTWQRQEDLLRDTIHVLKHKRTRLRQCCRGTLRTLW